MASPSPGLPDWFVAGMGTAAEQANAEIHGQCCSAGARGISQGSDRVPRAKQQDALKSLPEVEESLEELTELCTNPKDKACAYTAVIPDMSKNKVAALIGVTDELERADTHDSISTTNLLADQQPGGASQQPLPLPDEPGGSPYTTAGAFCAGKRESIKAQGTGAAGIGSSKVYAKASAAHEIEDVDDTLLVSKRTNPILDIMCGRSPLNTACAGSPMRATLQHTLPFLHSFISTASTGSIAIPPTMSGGLGITASGTSGGSFEPWGLGASISDASVPSILAGASTSGACIVPFSASGLASETAQAAPAAHLLYLGVFLTPESREVLLSMVPPVHPLLRGDHMTLVYKPSVSQLLQFPLGAEVVLHVLGSAADSRVQAVFVEAPSWLETSSDSTHITVSVAVGAKAGESGQLIKEALQQAALASAADLAYAPTGLGAYQHFDEPLPLIGRLGVCAAMPAGAVVSMGWARMDAAQLAAREAEVAVYSVDELVQSGYFNIDKGALQGFYRQHGDKLGKHMPSSPPTLPRPLALPAVPEYVATLDDALSSTCATPDASVKLLSTTATPANSNASPWLQWDPAHATSPFKSSLPVVISPSRALLGLVNVSDGPAGATAIGSYGGSPMPGSSPPSNGYGHLGVVAAGTAVAASPPSGGLAARLSARDSSAGTAQGAHFAHQMAALLAGAAGGHGGQAARPASGPSTGSGLAALLAAGGGSGGGAAAAPAAAYGLVSAQLAAVSTGRPGSAPAAAAHTPKAERLACTAAESAADGPEFHSPKSYSSSGGSSTDSMEAVQFLSAVHEGDYVAVRPFVPTEDNQRLVQGYVREFACNEPFQAEGVLVVLSDDTIGYVACVLDSQRSSQGGSSTTAPATKHSSSKKPTNSKSSSKKAQVDAHSGFSSRLTAAAAGTGAGVSSLSGPLQQWLADAGPELHPVMASAEPRHCTARDADRDLQLWHEFEALQQQYGENLCNIILQSCNQDFAEAIELIKGQAGGLQAVAGSNSSSAAASPITLPGAASQPAAGAAAGASDDFVCQLALSLGLLPEDALQLARLVPDLSADAVVRALQKYKGDVLMAADALLSDQATGAAADGGGSQHRSRASSPTGGNRGVISPEERAMKAFSAAGKDPELVVAAQKLCEMSPGLTMVLAELLLAEHGGNLHKAAQALSDMQACELEVRSAVAGEAASASSSMAGMQGLSALDREAIMEAMGQTEPQQQQQQQIPQGPKQQLPPSPVRSSPAYSASPPKRQGLTPLTQPQAGPSRYGGAQPSGHFSHPPPPPARQQAVKPPPQHVALINAFTAHERGRQRKEKMDAWHRKAGVLEEAMRVHMQAYKEADQEGDRDEARRLLAEYNELKKKYKASRAEVDAQCALLANPDCMEWKLDLHGQSAATATAMFVNQLDCLIGMKQPGGILFKVIVGQGRHSEDNVPKIKNQVLLYLKEKTEQALAATGEPWHITYEVDPTNAGCIDIHIPPKAATGS